MRRLILLCVSLGLLVAGWLGWRHLSSPRRPNGASGVSVDKQPAAFATRTFDPASPPSDMPPLSSGEAAECDSNFLSGANVGGEAQPTDDTHALVTITSVKVTLQLNGTVWLPAGASQHVTDHENGHRQISEHYYQSADQVAERVAASYLGQKVLITGPDLNAELAKLLQQTGAEITAAYNKELDPEPAQLLYDQITDHSRNDVVAGDAVAQALQNTPLSSTQPAHPGN